MRDKEMNVDKRIRSKNGKTPVAAVLADNYTVYAVKKNMNWLHFNEKHPWAEIDTETERKIDR